ncbi:MAG: protein kinase, partial [Clostridia bacterium]|nr:protein kinase [Clostridia bacterium]
IRRFKNESKAIAMLSHQNIVKVFDVSFGDRIQYIVMEYIEGITLKEYIEARGSLIWSEAVSFTIQILKALQHAHDKGIVHRDVKPQNIMVMPDNATIKVADFGIARFARSNQKTVTDMAIGSVHYISPEQARGDKTDEKADIYSVGVILYEMLTGKLPFDAESAVSVAIMQLQRDPQLPTEINASIPKGLEQITIQAMQKIPERRYQSAAEMLCELEIVKKDPYATFEHNYFIDSSPTRFVDEMSSTPASAATVDDVEDTEEKNRLIIPVLSGVAAALVIALVVLGVIFVPRLFGGTGAEIEYPNYVGKTMDDVKNDKDSENFIIKWEYEENNDYPQGTVFEQSPKAGKTAKKGAKLTLKVSQGLLRISVPDVYGQTESYAVSELKSKKMIPKIEYITDESVESGLVVRTDPVRTEVVAENTTITVYVSTGKSSQLVDLPNVLKITEAKAKDYLLKAGLVPVFHTRDIKADDEYCPKGYVLSQTPDVSSTPQVTEGTNVVIEVSSGIIDFDLEFEDVPDDFIQNNTRISLWIDDGSKMLKESELLDLSRLGGKYKFKDLKTSDKKLFATIKLKNDTDGENYEEICDITIDPLEGTYKIVKDYYYSQVKPEGEDGDVADDVSNDDT